MKYEAYPQGALTSADAMARCRVAVVIPAFRVARQVLRVIAGIGSEVDRIYVVDDGCPDHSGDLVEAQCLDPRVEVLRNPENRGVGAAVVRGYRAALEEGATVIVKLDGDGQMDPGLIPRFIAPILQGHADYCKGNRFFNIEDLRTMPKIRVFGNAALSFMAKLSTGYWDVFDPTNGYTAIHRSVLEQLPLDDLSPRYFFETDMLFRLNTLRAVVLDVPMRAHYADEESSLKIGKIIPEFLLRHSVNFSKRLFYNYYLRDMSVASIELPVGLGMCTFGLVFGVRQWMAAAARGEITPSGTVMLAALPTIIGIQLILAFLGHDIRSNRGLPLHRLIGGVKQCPSDGAAREAMVPGPTAGMRMREAADDESGRS